MILHSLKIQLPNLPLRLIHAYSSLPLYRESPVHQEKTKVLCVDDDESILAWLQAELEERI